MTSKYSKWNISATRSSSYLELKLTKPKPKIVQTEDNPQWNTTSKYQKWNISATTDCFIGSFSNFKLSLRRPNLSLQILQMKITSNGRRPQNIKS